MMRRCLIASCLLCLLLFLAVTSVSTQPVQAAAHEKSYHATIFDEHITIQNDGSLLVAEQVTFQFVGGPFTTVYRDLPLDKTDGIQVVQASMDDASATGIADNVSVGAASQGNQTEVQWFFDGISDETHTFYLTYLVKGVIQQQPGADWLAWLALPTSHEYTIDQSTITISYPARARLLHAAQNSQSDVAMTSSSRQVIFTAHDLGSDETLEADLSFAPSSVIKQPPHWQEQEQLTSYIFWPCLLGGIILLITGSIILSRDAKKSAHKNPPDGERLWLTVTAPPDDLSPALAGLIAQNDPMHVTQAHFLATVFDLVNRGVLEFQETEEQPFSFQKPERRYWLVPKSLPDDLQPYEQAALKLLFPGILVGRDRRNFSTISTNYQIHSQRFKTAVQQAIQQRGWLDQRRQAARKHLSMISLILFLVTLGGFITTIILLLCHLSALASLFFVDIACLILTLLEWRHCTRCVPITDEAWRQSWRWRKFSHFLYQVCANSAMLGKHDPGKAEQYLPYAASFGLTSQWLVHFYGSGRTAAPAWFVTQSDPKQRHATFVHFMYMNGYSSSTGGSMHSGGYGGGGYGGGGVAGGGGSGAH
jgi:Predicted membrane protein